MNINEKVTLSNLIYGLENKNSEEWTREELAVLMKVIIQYRKDILYPKTPELVASIMGDFVNNYGVNMKEFCQRMCRQHRTLQQTFTNLCFEWIKTCASKDYSYDGRNEASHIVCQHIVHQNGDEMYLPMI
jgi:hypothetical protein